MQKYNSSRSVKYLLYFIILILIGCRENTHTQAFFNEPAPTEPYSVEDNSHSIASEHPGKPHKTVWDRLFSLYALPEIDNERIEQQLQNYLQHPEYLTKIQKRAEPYLYFILDEIEARNIPGELALLPAVESAFRPEAISQSYASGLWQFMPATGRYFGLKQNWWYDGRNDIYASTKAATTYLKQLNELYDNDWHMALAAYNAGKGNIRKIIRKNLKNNLETDYWSLPLRKETMDYVPRLLALAKIFANADKYNIPLQDIPNTPHFTVIDTESQLDFSVAAKMAQTPVDDFLDLNPAFKRWSADPEGPFHILVLSEKAEEFKLKLAKIPAENRLKWIRHKIKSGDNLGAIAIKYHSTVKAIRQSNHLKNNKIRAGKHLLIPTSLKKSLAKALSKNDRLYVVKKGDTFWDIARLFAVSTKEIAYWNRLSLKKSLRPGQKLIIKKSKRTKA
ncbi:MAG: LysM peptidoglycan-binding domain-containing protein [Methylococcales bacterium]|nr:LysM peptidoglycan-binding domain-containing protein [Methylococcales bacterium]